MKHWFRMREAASLVGVTAATMRYWEDEFHLRIERSKSGQRVYSRANIEELQAIRELVHVEGLTVWGARRRMGFRDVAALGVGSG